MNKRKNTPPFSHHHIICMLLTILMFASLRFPLVFLDGWYWLTRVFYFIASMFVVTYGYWLFREVGIRYIAAFIIALSLLLGAFNFFRFSLPFAAECDQNTPIRRVCFMNWVEYDSLTYAHWNEVTFFYTVGDLPVGIWYRSMPLE